MPPQEGIHNMIEKVMPRVCAQSGRAVVEVVRARPYVHEDEGPEVMIDRRYE